MKAAGVNPTDTYTRSGTSRRPTLPYTPGIDAAGIVEAVGEGVTRVKVGARVYISGSMSGAYAEQALCDGYQVHPLPDNVTFGQGAGVNIPYATAYRALFQLAKATPGEIVLVHGASGGVGVAAVQLPHTAGMEVIGTGGTRRGRKLADRTRRPSCVRPSFAQLSQSNTTINTRSRCRRDTGDACQRQP